jgi:hypothetical protein
MSSNNNEDSGFDRGAVDSGFGDTPERMTREEAMGTGSQDAPEQAVGGTEETDAGVAAPAADDELYSPTNNDYTIPYVMFRGNAEMWRGKNAVVDGERITGAHKRVDVFPETVDIVENVSEELNDEFESSRIHLRDTVELLLRTGAENLEEVKEEAAEWGFQK